MAQIPSFPPARHPNLSWPQLVSQRCDEPSFATLSAISFTHLKAAPYFAREDIFDIVNKEGLQSAGVCARGIGVGGAGQASTMGKAVSVSTEPVSEINRKYIKTGFKAWWCWFHLRGAEDTHTHTYTHKQTNKQKHMREWWARNIWVNCFIKIHLKQKLKCTLLFPCRRHISLSLSLSVSFTHTQTHKHTNIMVLFSSDFFGFRWKVNISGIILLPMGHKYQILSFVRCMRPPAILELTKMVCELIFLTTNYLVKLV